VKRYWTLTLAILAVAPLCLATAVFAQEALQSLRGDATLEEVSPVPNSQRPMSQDGGFTRAYRQQPPLVPHTVDDFQVDLKVNQCMHCHDWPFNVDANAPKISETHYVNRDGVALDRVSGTRWFCTQCHVPQLNARILVENDFKSAFDVE
jgi:cytochrome c-type protein NapB